MGYLPSLMVVGALETLVLLLTEGCTFVDVGELEQPIVVQQRDNDINKIKILRSII